MTKLKNLFAKNVLVKIICLVTAIILWAYVSSAENSIAKFPGSIPIKTLNNQSDLIAVYDVKTVEIKVVTESLNWENLSTTSFSAYVDLAGYSAGTFEVPVNVVCSVPGVQVVEKTPDKIMVSLEPVVSKEVSVTKKIEGDAAAGMIVDAVNFTPDKVSLRGAESVIENISEVTAKIQLDGESVNFERKILLSLPDDKNSQSNIEISPPETMAQVSIIKGSGIKTVGIKANITGTPQNNFYISDIKITPSVVDITGLAGLLIATKNIETVPINVNNITAFLVKETQLALPEGIYLSGNASLEIQVEIRLAPIDNIQELSTSSFKLLNSNGTAHASYAPSAIKIQYTAPASLIGIIKSSDFVISIDLSQKATNSAGDYTINITNDMISAPAGISILEISPSSVIIHPNSS